MHHFSPEEYLKKFSQGCFCYFCGLKFDKLLFFWVAQNESYFWGVEKQALLFWVNRKFALFFWVAEKINSGQNEFFSLFLRTKLTLVLKRKLLLLFWVDQEHSPISTPVQIYAQCPPGISDHSTNPLTRNSFLKSVFSFLHKDAICRNNVKCFLI